MPDMPAIAATRDLCEDITRLRALRATPSLDTLATWQDRLSDALAREERRWLSEERARRRSNHAVAWLRRQFARWEAVGVGRWRDGKREYHEAIIEAVRLELSVVGAREQARLDAAA